MVLKLNWMMLCLVCWVRVSVKGMRQGYFGNGCEDSFE